MCPLVVQVYEQGNISKHLGEMKEGDSIEAKGPIPKLPYKANMKKKIGLIAGMSPLPFPAILLSPDPSQSSFRA